MDAKHNEGHSVCRMGVSKLMAIEEATVAQITPQYPRYNGCFSDE